MKVNRGTKKLDSATRCLLNGRRRKHGLGGLDASSKLRSAAREHSDDMARRNYFSHTSQNGDTFLTRIRRTGYLLGSTSWSVAENIAWGSGGYARPRSIVRRWMKSPEHRANILSLSFRDIGVGVGRGVPVSGDGAT